MHTLKTGIFLLFLSTQMLWADEKLKPYILLDASYSSATEAIEFVRDKLTSAGY